MDVCLLPFVERTENVRDIGKYNSHWLYITVYNYNIICVLLCFSF